VRGAPPPPRVAVQNAHADKLAGRGGAVAACGTMQTARVAHGRAVVGLKDVVTLHTPPNFCLAWLAV